MEAPCTDSKEFERRQLPHQISDRTYRASVVLGVTSKAVLRIEADGGPPADRDAMISLIAPMAFVEYMPLLKETLGGFANCDNLRWRRAEKPEAALGLGGPTRSRRTSKP